MCVCVCVYVVFQVHLAQQASPSSVPMTRLPLTFWIPLPTPSIPDPHSSKERYSCLHLSSFDWCQWNYWPCPFTPVFCPFDLLTFFINYLAWAVFLWRLPARFHQPHTNKLQVTNKLHTVKSITFVYSFVCVCLCMHAGKLLCLSLYTGKHLKEYCLADQCFILLCCCFPPLPAMDQLFTWRTLPCHSTPHFPMTSRL